jgi:hypothetical protein
MSEKIKPRPTGGSKASCGNFSMLPTGTLGKTALLTRSSPDTASVTSTEKAKGWRLAKRLTSTPMHSWRLLSEPLLKAGERRVA